MTLEGENRTILLAVLASLALHAALVLIWPSVRDAQPRRSYAKDPILARLVEPERKESLTQVPVALPVEPPAQLSPRVTAKPLQPARAAPVKPLVPQPIASNRPAPQPPPWIPEASDPGTVAQYRLVVLSAARRFKGYPAIAIENNWQGKAEIRVAVDADGSISSVSIRASAGHVLLDLHALEMIERATAASQVPTALRGRAFTVDVPVEFLLREAG